MMQIRHAIADFILEQKSVDDYLGVCSQEEASVEVTSLDLINVAI